MDDRYSRNEGLFGKEGQRAIENTEVAIVGAGGLGMQVIQQLAYLGTKSFAVIDFDVVTRSSLNRLIGATEEDAASKTKKVLVAKRTIQRINSATAVTTHDGRVNDRAAEALIASADLVFGCLDDDSARLDLTRIAAEYATAYFDLATDIGGGDDAWWGGRVVLSDETQCLVCLGLLDLHELARAAMTTEQQEADKRIYGIDRAALRGTGPMVVSINGAIASVAVTEFIALITGLRAPTKNLTYRADLQRITNSLDLPSPSCYYCRGLWGKKA